MNQLTLHRTLTRWYIAALGVFGTVHLKFHVPKVSFDGTVRALHSTYFYLYLILSVFCIQQVA
jgi:hypothetical protein